MLFITILNFFDYFLARLAVHGMHLIVMNFDQFEISGRFTIHG